MASRILHEFTIDKIAAVDSPCQEHATVTIMKRNNSDELRKQELAQRVLKLKMDVLQGQIKKVGWTDEARAASLEARRRHGKSLTSTKIGTATGHMETAKVGHHVSLKSGGHGGRIIHIRNSPSGSGHVLTLHKEQGNRVTEKRSHNVLKD